MAGRALAAGTHLLVAIHSRSPRHGPAPHVASQIAGVCSAKLTVSPPSNHPHRSACASWPACRIVLAALARAASAARRPRQMASAQQHAGRPGRSRQAPEPCTCRRGLRCTRARCSDRHRRAPCARSQCALPEAAHRSPPPVPGRRRRPKRLSSDSTGLSSTTRRTGNPVGPGM